MEGFISENNPENEYHKVVLEVKDLQTNENETPIVFISSLYKVQASIESSNPLTISSKDINGVFFLSIT